jgi:hypothetical protein
MKLADLKFSAEKRPTPTHRASPIERMRANILKGIGVQVALLNEERTGHPADLVKSVRRADGTQETVQRRPRKWFWQAANGAFFAEMLYGGKPVPLSGGKSAVECGDLDGVEHALKVLAEVVASGDLDKPLSESVSRRKSSKKAAAH